MNLAIDQYCFACGRDNPIGLKLCFESLAEGVRADLIPIREYQGFADLLHGGIISTLLELSHGPGDHSERLPRGYCSPGGIL